jgi:hypothetical protein
MIEEEIESRISEISEKPGLRGRFIEIVNSDERVKNIITSGKVISGGNIKPLIISLYQQFPF